MKSRNLTLTTLLSSVLLLFLTQAMAAPGWNSLGSGLNGSVYAIFINGDDVYAGGAFTNAGGDPDADYIARWDGSAWHAVGAGLNAAVRCVALDAANNIYVGGEFTDAGGNADADRIAFWDGSAWQTLGAGLSHTAWAIGISGPDIYVGGDFGNAGGNANADYIARWDGSTWQALGAGTGNWVRGIAINGSDVYVTGGFSNVGGNPNADGVARWDGASWHALGTGGMTFWAHAIAISGNNVYIGGGFYSAGGNPNANFIARWDGNSWNALGAGTGGSVFAIVVDGSDVYAGGSFFNAGGNAGADNIARWDGSSWNALGNGLSTTTYAAALQANNVYAGGDFLNAGGNGNADRIARWENTILPVELTGFTAIPQKNSILLNWQTQSELHNEYFQVEHSVDGQEFFALDRVPGNGNSHLPLNYTYRHLTPAKGLNYYRLIQTDYDGTKTISPIARAIFSDPDVIIAPNPASQYVTLTGVRDNQATIRVLSLSGTVILEKKTNDGVTTIELINSPPGLYVVEIDYGAAITRRQLVIE